MRIFFETIPLFSFKFDLVKQELSRLCSLHGSSVIFYLIEYFETLNFLKHFMHSAYHEDRQHSFVTVNEFSHFLFFLTFCPCLRRSFKLALFALFFLPIKDRLNDANSS